MQSSALTVPEYLAALPADRRAAIAQVRAIIRKNLPKGYAEKMQYGMIGYVVPHKLYPAGYHCKPEDPLPLAALASQKNHMALYLMLGGQLQWLKDQFAAEGRKLDIGKSCIRFRKVEDLPLEAVGKAIAQVPVADYIAQYEVARGR
jgi:hypothetical protein